jgi:MFS family permease
VIPPIFQTYNEVYGITYAQLNNAYAINGIGLAVGCNMFIPFALKWGRRSVYIISIFVTLLCGVWFATTHTYANLMGAYFLCGVSGAVSETLVQMTVCIAHSKIGNFS